MRKSSLIILFLIVVFIILLVLLIEIPEQMKAIVHEDGYDQLWQVALAGIGGGFISWAFAELKTEQEKREAKRQYINNFMARVISSYNSAKKCRRLLRASCVSNNGSVGIKLSKYVEIMGDLEDSQLEFEGFVREMAVNHFKLPPELKLNFETMEKYLAHVLKRFEAGNRPEESVLALSHFDSPVVEFIDHKKFIDVEEKERAPFHAQFARPLEDVEGILTKELST